jgi:hypothetical protein
VTGSAFGDWCYWWLWESHGVGNFAADAIVGTVGYFVGVRRGVRRLHDKLDAHHEEQMGAHHVTHVFLAALAALGGPR